MGHGTFTQIQYEAWNDAVRRNFSCATEASMCPFCLATAALIAGSIATTGGLTAFVVKKTIHGKSNNIPTNSPTTEDQNG